MFLALAKDVVVDGAVTPNAAANWADVNPALPAQPILAFIPGTKHGTREVFEEKVLLAGCEETGALEAFKAANNGDEDAAEAACLAVRTDGKSVDIDGDYTETLARIESDKNGVGVFGLSFYENNTDKLKVATINGVTPSVETVASGEPRTSTMCGVRMFDSTPTPVITSSTARKPKRSICGMPMRSSRVSSGCPAASGPRVAVVMPSRLRSGGPRSRPGPARWAGSRP